MQDIRKPYSHSKSNRSIASRVEAFEHPSSLRSDSSEYGAVQIPTRRERRSIEGMEMYPRRQRNEYADETFDQRIPIDTDPHTSFRDIRRRPRNEQTLGTWIFIAALVIVVLGIGLLTFVYNSATITVTPKYKDIDINETVLFSTTKSAGAVSYSLATTSLTKTKTLPLSETKKVETKASGNIVIYNNFDTNPQKLIKNTRFESPTGKIYRINQTVTVPGKKGETPGSVEVTVYADSYGADYNTPATDFTIPGFKGTPRYTGFFARSNGPMKGGAGGNVALVSQSDLDSAHDELVLEMTQAVKTSLKEVTQAGTVPLYSAIQVVFTDNAADVMSGGTATYRVDATGYLMLANEHELAAALAMSGMRDYANQPVRLAYADELVFTLKKESKSYADESLSVLVEGKPRIVLTTDSEALKEAFLGKNRSDAATIVQNIPSVTQIEMSFFPLWLSSIPTNKEHISVVESLPAR